MKKLILLFTIIALWNCTDSETNPNPKKSDVVEKITDNRKKYFKSISNIENNSENKLTEEKIVLGKKLYFDNRLSKDNTQSCNTCHNLNTYGVDNKPTSKGNDGILGNRNSPTTLNAALHIAQFWDGREKSVESQAGKPILNPVEMAMPSEQAVIDKLSKIEEYKNLFAKAFPNSKTPITYENLSKAIGAFERKLITPSKFDKFLEGKNDALTNDEKKGLETFINSGCIACHSGSLLGGKTFMKFGIHGNYWEYTKSKNIDKGKFEVTKNEADLYVFKVPSLRNIEKTAPYFHDGSINTIEEAIKIMAKLQVNKDLTEDEIKSITLFLNTLTASIPEEYKSIKK